MASFTPHIVIPLSTIATVIVVALSGSYLSYLKEYKCHNKQYILGLYFTLYLQLPGKTGYYF